MIYSITPTTHTIPLNIYIRVLYHQSASPLLEKNIDRNRMILNISHCVLDPYSFLLSSPYRLRRYESERLTAVPKHTPSIVASTESIANVFQRIGIRKTQSANRSVNTRKKNHLRVFIRIERKLPTIAPIAEYKRIIVAAEFFIPKVVALYSTDAWDTMVDTDQNIEEVIMIGR